MYDPDSCRILLYGREISHFKLQDLRAQISYVPQDVFLFSDTIMNNIRFGRKDASQEQALQAATHASIHKEIQQFERKYETMVGERGVTLSGGQKQRISIARALIKEPRIIIFDDCLSAVDPGTEKEILNNLHHYLEDKTAIIITHRIVSLFEFDQVVVMDEGRIIESGTHDTLITLNGYYKWLYDQQKESAS